MTTRMTWFVSWHGSNGGPPPQAGRRSPGWSSAMTLLDRFRTQPATGIPIPRSASRCRRASARRPRTIAAMAREDEDPRVRRAAVAKLMDAAALGRASPATIATSRAGAGASPCCATSRSRRSKGSAKPTVSSRRRDQRPARPRAGRQGRRPRDRRAARALAHERRALVRIDRAARLASRPSARAAFERLRERSELSEILAVAMNSDFKDTGVGGGRSHQRSR